MKRIVLIILAIAIMHPMHAASSWQVGTDLRCIDSAFMGALRLDLEASYRFGRIRLTLPIRYSHSFSHELDFAETGLIVSVYPFDGYGFFAAVSLVRLGVFWGLEAPEDRFMFFSEAIVGWTFEFPYFYIEPRVWMTDIFSAESGRMDILSEAVPQYSRFRIGLVAGTAF